MVPIVTGQPGQQCTNSVAGGAVVQELVEAGYTETVRQLHVRYQRGELTFRAVAAELGLSVRELYDLFEQKGLPT